MYALPCPSMAGVLCCLKCCTPGVVWEYVEVFSGRGWSLLESVHKRSAVHTAGLPRPSSDDALESRNPSRVGSEGMLQSQSRSGAPQRVLSPAGLVTFIC